MKFANHIAITVFANQTDDIPNVKQTLIDLIPFNISDEKISVEQHTADGFGNERIKIFLIDLVKERHTNAFLKSLVSKLSDTQKALLISQKESRLDEEMHFFIRLEKTALQEGRILLTDAGNCYHINMSIAAFPVVRAKALEVVEKIIAL